MDQTAGSPTQKSSAFDMRLASCKSSSAKSSLARRFQPHTGFLGAPGARVGLVGCVLGGDLGTDKGRSSSSSSHRDIAEVGGMISAGVGGGRGAADLLEMR